uniref:hypothetical protein n=1 Tax=Enterocloster clostridioformis TaxID=1531 RepID=UPI0025A6721F
ATSQGHSGLNEVKASVFRRWPVTAPYRGEQTTRLTGGHDFSAYFPLIFPLLAAYLCSLFASLISY